MISAARDMIKQVLNSTLPPVDSDLKYMETANYEQRDAEQKSQLIPISLVLTQKYFRPCINQYITRLLRRGELTIGTPQLVQAALDAAKVTSIFQLIRVDVNAAIDRALAIQEAQQIAQGIAATAQVIGVQKIQQWVDTDIATPKLLKGFGVPVSMIRTLDQAAAIAQAQSGQMQLNAGLNAQQGQPSPIPHDFAAGQPQQ